MYNHYIVPSNLCYRFVGEKTKQARTCIRGLPSFTVLRPTNPSPLTFNDTHILVSYSLSSLSLVLTSFPLRHYDQIHIYDFLPLILPSSSTCCPLYPVSLSLFPPLHATCVAHHHLNSRDADHLALEE